jgi:hypothetical protein
MIKRLLVSVFLCALLNVAVAQGEAANTADSLERPAKEKFQVYVGISYLGQQFVETMASFVNFSGGIIYNNHFEARISYGAIVDDFKKQIIFPTTFSYQQNNLSLMLQYSFFESRIRPVAGLSINYGQASWLPQGDVKDIYTDNIFTYGTYAGLSWAINRAVTLQTDVGYSKIQKLELVGLEETDFNGFRFEIQLKFGIFRFK